MVLRRAGAGVEHRCFRDLPELLDPGDLLVVNNSRVFPARIQARRASGGRVEVLLLRELSASGEWEALLRPGRRLRVGESLLLGDAAEPALTVTSAPFPGDPRRRVRLAPPPATVPAWLERVGEPPLPPYIRRSPEPADRERYQTVFARERGSVAAPTAGLHFTAELLARLDRRGVGRAEVLLHVGLGTFRPVGVRSIADHRVDPEPVVVPEQTVSAVVATRRRGRRVVAVGTTSVRALESAAGVDGSLRALAGETDLAIVPGHRFRATDALITNFHLPRSSLLLLVAALAGRERILAAYHEAIATGYRFYSYGDAMLIL